MVVWTQMAFLAELSVQDSLTKLNFTFDIYKNTIKI